MGERQRVSLDKIPVLFNSERYASLSVILVEKTALEVAQKDTWWPKKVWRLAQIVLKLRRRVGLAGPYYFAINSVVDNSS